MATYNPYGATVRRIEARAELDFYTGGDDKDCEIILNGGNISDKLQSYQLITKGLTPAYKYATLDGYTKLGETRIYGGAPDTVFPIWAEGSMSGTSYAAGYAFRADAGYRIPVYRINFGDARELDHVTVIGDTKWGQGPTQFDVTLFLPNGETRTVTHRNTVDFLTQTVDFDFCICIAMELKVTHWSAAHTAARIMYFGASENMTVRGDEIESLTVLEEKSAGVDHLSYGLTSNVCTLKLKNTDNRFLRNPDFLKRNRKIRPAIACTDYAEQRAAAEAEYVTLGTFYSDSWDVNATSQYIKCEAYDALYGLQNLTVYYLMDKQTDGYYVMDGTESYGTTIVNAVDADGYPIRVNTIGAVFRKIFWLINKKRIDSGIFNAQLHYEIDPRLDTIPIRCVLLGRDSAWNMLQDAAMFALAFVYADRDGKIHVDRDRFDEVDAPAVVDCGVSIHPSNSYSFNLPSFSKICVNNVKATYSVLEAVDVDPKDEQLKVPINSTPTIGQYAAELKLEKTYKKFKIKTDFNSDLGFVEVAFDAIGCTLLKMNTVEMNIHVNEQLNGFQVKNSTKDFSRPISVRRYGFNSFDLKNKLATNTAEVETNAIKILDRYEKGFNYIETEWRGDSRAEIGTTVFGKTRIASESKALETELSAYEILSNEITIENGLRCKVKALESKGSAG